MLDFSQPHEPFLPHPTFTGSWLVYNKFGHQLGTIVPDAVDPRIFKLWAGIGFGESIGLCRGRNRARAHLARYRRGVLRTDFYRSAGMAGHLHGRVTEGHHEEEDQ